jgi:hypothetical protein
MRADEFIDAGEHVVVRVHQEGRGVGSGVPVMGTYWYLVRLRDGKGVSMEICASREQALEAAGLSE